MDSIVGGILGALVGVVGLAIVTWIQRRDSYRSRFETALSELMTALGRHRVELQEWADSKREVFGFYGPGRKPTRTLGGPSVEPIKTLVDVAWMFARRGDAKGVGSVGLVIFELHDAPFDWTLEALPTIVQELRLWRTGELTTAQLASRMTEALVEVQSSRPGSPKADDGGRTTE